MKLLSIIAVAITATVSTAAHAGSSGACGQVAYAENNNIPIQVRQLEIAQLEKNKAECKAQNPDYFKRLEAEAAAEKDRIAAIAARPLCDDELDRLGCFQRSLDTEKRVREVGGPYNQRVIDEAEAQIAKIKEDARKQSEQQASAMLEREQKAMDEAAKPENRMIRAYRFYSNIAFCNQIRQGYALVWINDLELERAKIAVKAIEKSLLAEEPDLDTRTLWQVALSQARGWQANQASCNIAYADLRSLSPVNIYPIQKP
jgi:hypothetical protein